MNVIKYFAAVLLIMAIVTYQQVLSGYSKPMTCKHPIRDVTGTVIDKDSLPSGRYYFVINGRAKFFVVE